MNEEWTEEQAYDERIAPLMAQIIDICKERQIPLVASFQYANDEEGPAYCTTVIITGTRPSVTMRRLASEMRPNQEFALAETHVTNPNGSKSITIRRIS